MYCDSVQTTRRRVFAGPVALQQSSAWTFLARQSGTSSHSSSRSSGWSQNKLELEPSESRRWQRRARRSRNHRHIRSTMDSLLTAASLNPVHTQVVRADDTFELYDLKVEVVCPPNERILCGAKDGDYFILQGEMLTLPPGQGISIYSLSTNIPGWVESGPNCRARCRPTSPSCKTENDTPERLDDH